MIPTQDPSYTAMHLLRQVKDRPISVYFGLVRGRKESDCPYRVASTEPMRTLREAWIAGHQRATMAKGRRR